MRKIISMLLLLALVLTGCGTAGKPETTAPSGAPVLENTIPPSETSGNPGPTNAELPTTDAAPPTEPATQPEHDASGAVTIQLNGTSAHAGSDSVQIKGSTVIIKEEATYVISGSLSGMLVVDAPDSAKVQLILNGADITSESSAALYILEADDVTVTLAEGTTNTLSNGGSFVAIDDNNIDGALFSKQDLTLNGSGSLTVISPAGHGIVCKDDLAVTGGAFVVNAASHGIDANDSVSITDANITIDAGKDAIHCENSDDAEKGFICLSGGTIHAEAEGDGISAGAYLQIDGGTIELLVGGGSENGSKVQSDSFGGFMGGGPGGGRPGGMGPGNSQNTGAEEEGTSMKGLKAANGIAISGGTLTINSADDAIHSDTSITISGGTFSIASGDDAIHAEETLTVTAGTINISESYEGLEALHIAVQGGDIHLVASDDGLNAAGGTDQSGTEGGRDGMFGRGPGGMSANSNGSIHISGGNLYIKSSGDGLDANGTLEISGGYTVVVGPTQGDTATLDYDKTGVITGGTFIGTGAMGMAQTFSDSGQGVIAVSVSRQSAGTKIILEDAKGNVLITHEPELSFALVILSSPELVKGETYTIIVGNQSGSFEAR